MTSYDDTKVQLTINRMTEECYDNLSGKSSTELYLVSRDPTSPAKIDLDAQEKVDAEISQLSAWASQQIGLTNSHVSALETRVGEIAAQVGDNTSAISANSDAIGELQNDTSILSGLTLQNAQDIQDLSANLTHSIVRRWEYVEYNGLTFTAEEANSTISMQKVGTPPDVSLEYSTGDGWNDFIVGETTVTLPNIGDQVVIRAKTANEKFATDYSNSNRFSLTGKIAASDSIMYLLKSDGTLSELSADYTFFNLFRNCTSLTTAPELPATTLSQDCYRDMFNGCSALTTPPPSLPALNLPRACYQGMFNGCTSLLATPATLGATTMSGNDTMGGMFGNCSSMTSAFDINVEAPTVGAFYGTFYGCSSLPSVNVCQMTSAPQNAFREMFYNCTSLTTAPDVFANISSVGQQAFSKTFYGCTSITQIPTLPTALGDLCFEHMFEGCTGLTGTIDLTQFTDIQGTGTGYGAFDYAFVGCTGITKVDLSNLTTTHGIYHEFDGCTSLVELDLSNLETIRSDSQAALENMCNGCTSLTTVKLNKLASMGSYTTQWHNTFKGCSSLQNIYMNEAQTIPYFYNNDTFTNANADYKIYVPASLYDQWIVASGWSDSAIVPHIVAASAAQPLTFTALQANSTVRMSKSGSAPSLSLEYSVDDGSTWQDFIVGTTTVTLSNVGDKMMIRAKTTNERTGVSDNVYNKFVMTGSIAASGSIAYLLKNDGDVSEIQTSGCFWCLFLDCTALKSIPTLVPTSSTATDVYRMTFYRAGISGDVDMTMFNVITPRTLWCTFYGCSSLQSADLSNVQTLGEAALNGTFYQCRGLTEVRLDKVSSATTDSFHSAFDGCTSMQNIWFSNSTAVPSLQTGTDGFINMNSTYAINVPASLYDTWRNSDGWNSTGIQSHITPIS